MIRRAKRFVEMSKMSKQQSYMELMQIFDHRAKQELCTRAFAQGQPNADRILAESFSRAGNQNFLNQMLYVDVKKYLAEDLLVKMDRATMAHALEARSPYLDHQLMEFAATIPPRLKLRQLTIKYILKKVLRPYLPKN